MTKNDLVRKLHEETPLSLAQALELLNKLGEILAAELLGGGEASIPGVGKLRVKTRAARKGRNPRTGKALDIPERRAVVFSMGKDLKAALAED
ncbi:MAG: HU family DNA-binding protein [Deltaproteobacteria bacterium]|nr:HU family DNA-binding protein [Deltaproteobacteria bacterium]